MAYDAFNWPREKYRMADTAHRAARRINGIALERWLTGQDEEFGDSGTVSLVPVSPRPVCEPDRIHLLREWRPLSLRGHVYAVRYGEFLQAVVSPVGPLPGASA